MIIILASLFSVPIKLEKLYYEMPSMGEYQVDEVKVLEQFYQSFTHFRILDLRITFHYLFLIDKSSSMLPIIDDVNSLLRQLTESIHVEDKRNIFGSFWLFNNDLKTNPFFDEKRNVIALINDKCSGATNFWPNLLNALESPWDKQTSLSNKRIIIVTDGEILVPQEDANNELQYHKDQLTKILNVAYRKRIRINLNYYFNSSQKGKMRRLWRLLKKHLEIDTDVSYANYIKINGFEEDLEQLKINLAKESLEMQREVFDICTFENFWWIYLICEKNRNLFKKNRWYFYPLLAFAQCIREKERVTHGDFRNYLIRYITYKVDEIIFYEGENLLELVNKENCEIQFDDLLSFFQSTGFINNYVSLVLTALEQANLLKEVDHLLSINTDSKIFTNVIKPYFLEGNFLFDYSGRGNLKGLMNSIDNLVDSEDIRSFFS